MENNTAPVIKQDLLDLKKDFKQELLEVKQELKQDLLHLEKRSGQELHDSQKELETRMVERLTETMRDMQTEIIRGFHVFSTGVDIRLRKLEADHVNLDTSATLRLANVEQRLLEIEKRLLMGGS